MAYAYLIAAFLLNASGNILLKIGSQKGLAWKGLGLLEILRSNAIALTGLILFGLNALFYFIALKTLPISIAYPAMVVMSFVIINSFAYFFLNEHIYPAQWIGYILLLSGLAIIFAFAKQQ